MKLGLVTALIVLAGALSWASSTEPTSEDSSALTASSSSSENEPINLEKTKSTPSEDQIPLNISQGKKAETTENSNGRLYLSFGLMAALLGLGYYFAKRYGRPGNSKQTQIKVLTQYYLGPKKSLAIVRVAGESILIGVTDQNISMIKSLALLDDEIPENVSTASFESTLNDKKELTLGKSEFTGPGNGEEFSIRHIKDVVSLKLKGMRNEL